VGLERNYFLYILIGTVMWNFFAMATSGGLASIVDNPNIVKNTAFPKGILVYSAIGTFIIQHFFELLTIFLFIGILGVGFSIHILFLPFIIGVEILLITGISLFLSCLCVYAFDLRHIWEVVTRMAFFVVPIFYTASEISPKFRWVVAINPMSQIMMFSRDVLLYHQAPSLSNLIIVFVFSLFLLIAGYKIFKHYEYSIAEKV
jgi:lipopolysaccharide transport system permease protein